MPDESRAVRLPGGGRRGAGGGAAETAGGGQEAVRVGSGDALLSSIKVCEYVSAEISWRMRAKRISSASISAFLGSGFSSSVETAMAMSRGRMRQVYHLGKGRAVPGRPRSASVPGCWQLLRDGSAGARG